MTFAGILIQLPVLLFSIVIHEYAHGWVAERFGDDTARSLGRLTLNPIPHIDMVGTILLPGMAILTGMPVFGWAKPVPINPNRFKNPLKDLMWVSLAGPLANFSLACCAAIGIWLIKSYGIVPAGISLSVFELLRFVLIINVILTVLNLLPIPPLDGSKIVLGLLPSRYAYQFMQIERYGFIILILLLVTI